MREAAQPIRCALYAVDSGRVKSVIKEETALRGAYSRRHGADLRAPP